MNSTPNPSIPTHPVLSVVVPMHNEAQNLTVFFDRLRSVLEPVGLAWELVCINDGSTDDTLDRLLALRAQDARVVILDLSRNFGKEAALTAGLLEARGDAAVPMDADLQDPPELLPAMIAQWRAGYDMVLATRSSRQADSWLKRHTARWFYTLINRLSEVPIPENAGDFRLMNRAVLEALRQFPERRRFMKGLFAWVGFKVTSVSYERPERLAGVSKFNFWRLWNFALEGITSFSHVPLRMASYLGFAVSSLTFLYALKIILDTLIHGNAVKGYPSLMVAILFFAGVQLMALGIIGEYLGRLYEESKQRPLYFIRAYYGPTLPAPIRKGPTRDMPGGS